MLAFIFTYYFGDSYTYFIIDDLGIFLIYMFIWLLTVFITTKFVRFPTAHSYYKNMIKNNEKSFPRPQEFALKVLKYNKITGYFITTCLGVATLYIGSNPIACEYEGGYNYNIFCDPLTFFFFLLIFPSAIYYNNKYLSKYRK